MHFSVLTNLCKMRFFCRSETLYYRIYSGLSGTELNWDQPGWWPSPIGKWPDWKTSTGGLGVLSLVRATCGCRSWPPGTPRTESLPWSCTASELSPWLPRSQLFCRRAGIPKVLDQNLPVRPTSPKAFCWGRATGGALEALVALLRWQGPPSWLPTQGGLPCGQAALRAPTWITSQAGQRGNRLPRAAEIWRLQVNSFDTLMFRRRVLMN